MSSQNANLSDDEDNDQTNSQQKIVANEHQKSTTDQSNFDAENFIKTDRIKFVNEIIPKDCLSFVRCHVERRRQGLSTMFSLFFDGQNEQNATFLLNARKHLTIGGHSEYFIGINQDNSADLNETNSIGKLRAMNLTSTQYILYDHQNSSNKNQQSIAIVYDDHSLGEKGPRKLVILLPDQEKDSLKFEKENETIIDHWKLGNFEGLIEIKNQSPTFNEKSQIYTLDMKGSRVKQPSHKNFQLINSNDNSENNIVMQFGRIDENTFALDYRFPFTALQAFAIALSSFHNRFRQ